MQPAEENRSARIASTSEEPIFSVRTYSACFATLVALTLSSFGLSYAHLGGFETAVAMGIAAAKVSLVAIYFMHLAKEPSSHRLAAVAGGLFVIILSVLSVLDVITRHS